MDSEDLLKQIVVYLLLWFLAAAIYSRASAKFPSLKSSVGV